MEKLRSRFRLAPTYTLLWLAAAALLSASSCSDGGTTTPTCVAPNTPCDGICVDTSASADHCGACGVACTDGEVCQEGACTAACGEGRTACDGACVDLQSNAAHCGSCDTACAEGETCEGGDCRGGDDCAEGETECGGECVDLDSSAEHCGACGEACAEGQTCQDGACRAATCSAGLTRCGGECVDILTDVAHCGGCDAACGADQTCTAGACADGCGSGLTACGDTCVDTQTSDAHCGACGAACGDLQVCQTGECACTVTPGQDLGSDVPQDVHGNTAMGSDTYASTCVATSSRERIYSFTAPSAGIYSFDSRNSSIRVALTLLDAAGCSELACNADAGAAAITADLGAGQTVFLVADGVGNEVGAFEINIRRANAPSCPAGSLGSEVPTTITGTTVGRPNSVTPTECGSSMSPDAGYTFTAPAAGDYAFDTFGSDYDTVLHVHDATCGGRQLACNDDTDTMQSEVTVTLAAGQTVVAVVDGTRTSAVGTFTLRVRRALPVVCDGTGVCGDGAEGCVRCAFDRNCRDELAACTNSADCLAYVSCLRICDEDRACEQTCRAGDAASAALYDAALVCAHCNECPIDCGGSGVACP